MRQPCLYPIAYLVKNDETADVGLLDRARISYSGERAEVDGFANGEGVDHVADRAGQTSDPSFDQFDEAGR